MNKFEKLFDSLCREFLAEARHTKLVSSTGEWSKDDVRDFLTYDETYALHKRYIENLSSPNLDSEEQNKKIIAIVIGSMVRLLHTYAKQIFDLGNGKSDLKVIKYTYFKWASDKIQEIFEKWNRDSMYSFYDACKSHLAPTIVFNDEEFKDEIGKTDSIHATKTGNDGETSVDLAENLPDKQPSFVYIDFMQEMIPILSKYNKDFNEAFGDLYTVALRTMPDSIIDNAYLDINTLGLSSDLRKVIDRNIAEYGIPQKETGVVPMRTDTMRMLYYSLKAPYDEYKKKQASLTKESYIMDEYMKYLLI